MKKISSRKMPILFGTAIALFASLGLSQEAKAQSAITNKIPSSAVRTVNESNIDTNNPEQVGNSLSTDTQDSLQNVANSLSDDNVTVTVENLLSDPKLAQISLSPNGAEVLQTLLQAGRITGEPGNFTVDSGDTSTVANVEPPQPIANVEAPQGASVETTLEILGAK